MDEMEPTSAQKRTWIFEALGIAGFEQVGDMDVYTQEHGLMKIVADLSEGVCVYFSDQNKKRIDTDDEYETLKNVKTIITEAETGQMPKRNDPEEVVNVTTNTNSNHNGPTSTDTTELKDVQSTPTEPVNMPAVREPAQDCTPPAEITHSTAPPAPFVPQGTMIKGFVPGLKEIGKIKIGRKGATKTSQKGTEYRPPEKFDHFEVVTLIKDDNGDFIPDAAVMGLIGDNARELDVSLLYNDPTLNFFTRYNQYKGGKCMCSGDGERAVKADGTELVCNPDTCAAFATKKCKANGILSVILKDSPRLGGVYKFRTTSFNSIRSILSSLFFIQSLTGGVLADIPLKMTVAPMSVNPVSSSTAQTIYVVNLEYPGNMEDLQKQTIEIMTRKAGMQSKIVELEAQARIAITAPETKEEIQDAEYEFYPAAEKE